ncbi:hypothetical protein EVAR_18842_1 [Eumeta japonica]|uniref:Uncharacterized protein n=1 Tax=Eumeta variegata TaxID=151549 RepID=A0A4C1ULR6_EUMVA|nr:hypothetical protein EVAR_18842_1 [Eumeta japonica]
MEPYQRWRCSYDDKAAVVAGQRVGSGQRGGLGGGGSSYSPRALGPRRYATEKAISPQHCCAINHCGIKKRSILIARHGQEASSDSISLLNSAGLLCGPGLFGKNGLRSPRGRRRARPAPAYVFVSFVESFARPQREQIPMAVQ